MKWEVMEGWNERDIGIQAPLTTIDAVPLKPYLTSVVVGMAAGWPPGIDQRGGGLHGRES